MTTEDKEQRIIKMIKEFKTKHPEEYLTDLHSGRKPLSTDLKTIEVIKQTGLTNEVINVLINYTLLKLDGKFQRNYIKRVAEHCYRMNITTAEQAMDWARSQHDRDKIK